MLRYAYVCITYAGLAKHARGPRAILRVVAMVFSLDDATEDEDVPFTKLLRSSGNQVIKYFRKQFTTKTGLPLVSCIDLTAADLFKVPRFASRVRAKASSAHGVSVARGQTTAVFPSRGYSFWRKEWRTNRGWLYA